MTTSSLSMKPSWVSLLKYQFPQWAHLPLAPVEPSGTDHTIFRLGPAMSVQLPAVGYVTAQTAKEAKWLPFLPPQLPLVLPVPLAMGRPGQGLPLRLVRRALD